jgi:UDP-3-O-[3-hydroxymyristoyl] N-acetylglucosamine deacetylase
MLKDEILRMGESVEFQRTIAEPVKISGEGIFSGREIQVVLEPAEPGQGIIFIREDIKTEIPINVFNVQGLEGATAVIGKEGGIFLIEHLLSALHGLKIDNLIVRVWGEELPILDGSSRVWVRKIQEVGYRYDYVPRKKLRIKEPFEYVNGRGKIFFRPASSFKVHAEINFDHPLIGAQSFSLEITPLSYVEEVCFARTFGFKDDIIRKKEKGLLRGGSLDNAIVLDEKGVLNQEGLRTKDEFVRHKVLDIIGDMYALGLPLMGEVISYCSNHRLHIEALRALYTNGILEEVEVRPVRFFVIPRKRAVRS